MNNYRLSALRRITLLIIFNLCLVACGGGGDTAAPATTPITVSGKLVPEVRTTGFSAKYNATDPESLFYKEVVDGVLAETKGAIKEIKSAIKWPSDVPVVFSGCGTLNAFYSFGDAYALIASNNPAAVFGPNVTVPAIVMCHELTEKTVATFFNDPDLADKVRSLFNTTTPEEDLVAGVASALVFELQVLFHELGHAVDFLLLKDPNDSIKLANFTIPSPNTCTTPLCDTVANDFADWISAAVLVQVIQEKIKTDIDAAENFAKAWLIALDAWQTIVGTGGGVAHGLTQARQVNMLCYAYGAIPELRQADVDVLGNQLQTAISGQGVDPAGCETIYKRNDTSTTTLLGSFIN